MRTLPPVGFLLDVDGPLASPETRRVPAGVIAALVDLAALGIPVVFNTGRSADFVLQQLAVPLRAAGLTSGAPFHAVCEKGAVRFSFSGLPDGDLPSVTPEQTVPGWVTVDEAMKVPEELAARLREVVRDYQETMFHDETKVAMFSAEMNVGEAEERYRQDQRSYQDRVEAILTETGAHRDFTVDPTIIAMDVEHRTSGKDLGAERSWQLVGANGELPVRWYTCGDSRSDYAMADWLHGHGATVTHVDARPTDGVPDTPYPVLTSQQLSAEGFGPPDGQHEVTGQALLEWVLDSFRRRNASV
ncbi:haloacid dehalogenase [Citricoccus sp. GCM10030269]|uniref:haloacid dehalogenase n=1 Tax=Citricoccus sp. GCM10030269 TaxID=3273388 RepID=UPI0036179122